jgi:hypothetical protein
MGTAKQILTQDELTQLNEALQQLAANLKIHVNASLSVAHGFNVQQSTYYDSAGDVVGDYVLVFQFGTPPDTFFLYAPARLSSLGPSSASSGLTLTSTSPTGAFVAPGVPLASRSLVTQFTTEALALAQIYNNLLLDHAAGVVSDTGASQVHGGVDYSAGDVLDSLSHKVGRKYISMGVGGIDFSIPADLSITGPPQGPRLQPWSKSFYSFRSSSPNSALAGVPFQLTWLGDHPGTSKWEVSSDKSTWLNLSIAPYNAPPYSTGAQFYPVPGWQAGIEYVMSDTVSPQDTLTVVYMSPVENTWQHLYVRGTVTNAGGTATSQIITIDIYDKTGSWIVYAAHAVSPFSPREMRRLFRIRLWARKNRNSDVSFYLGESGEALVSKMRERGFDFSTLTDEIRGFLGDSNLDEEARFELFRTMVIRCLKEYWPDCPHPVAAAELRCQ